jgi:hypothetical protein
VHIAASSLTVDQSAISSEAIWDGDGGDVQIDVDRLIMMNGATVATDIDGAGLGGFVSVIADAMNMYGGSRISSDALEYSSGSAGDVSIEVNRLTMSSGSSIGSDAQGDGTSGTVEVVADMLTMSDGAQISTNSSNENIAGLVTIDADELILTGTGTRIASLNSSDGDAAGDAGSVYIASDKVMISEGARVSTNSLHGAAGDIEFSMSANGLLMLSGETAPGIIETSSGPSLGGRIVIASPMAIISNGGSIQALGDSGGANVVIDTPYFISSTDRFNEVAVDGELAFDTTPGDVSSGTVGSDLAVIDASGVMRGQCNAVRSTGRISQLNVRPVGPYASLSAALPTGAPSGERAAAAVGAGGCL